MGLIMDRRRHIFTKYLNDEKLRSAINSKLFKRLNHITDQLYEVELVKAEIEHREPIIVGFFVLQYAKQRMLELYIFKVLWSWQVWRTWNGQRLPLLGCVGWKFGRHYSHWKARRVECDTFGRLHRHFHCQRNRQFLSQNVLQHTQETR